MEDPVRVFGRSDVTPWGVHECITLIPIPETTYYIYDYRNTYSVMRPQTCLYCIVMSSMVFERSQLVSMIDRCIKAPYETIDPLWKWKAQLVLQKIRRNIAAKTIQKQFRESMSNPGYDLCKRRLLREFAEGI